MSDDELSYFNIQPRSTEIITLVCSRCWGTGVGILNKKLKIYDISVTMRRFQNSKITDEAPNLHGVSYKNFFKKL